MASRIGVWNMGVVVAIPHNRLIFENYLVTRKT